MSASSNGSGALGVRNWPAGEEDGFHASQSAIGGQYATLRLVSAAQSGLPCYWRCGLPATPTPGTRRTIELCLKRGMDIAGSAAMLVILTPFLVMLALAIRLSSPGPAVLWQERLGMNGRTFALLKFRTMFAACSDLSGVRQTIPGDRRVTPLGKLMRRRSLDELPQLLNVLRGDMSLVGPRPHVAGQLAAERPYAEVVPYYATRLAMRPGLTGWAQVNGYRGPTVDLEQARRRVDHDLAYIQNFSIALDIRILIRTAWQEVMRGSGS